MLSDTPYVKPKAYTLALNKLRPQQQRFLDSYLETGNAATAYRKAGYVQDRKGVTQIWLQQRASQVLNRPSVQHALMLAKQETKQRNEVTLDWISDQHIKLMDASLAVGDRQTATRNLELLGKMVGAYSEQLNITTDQRKEYTEREQAEMKRISTILLTQPQLPILDAVPTALDAAATPLDPLAEDVTNPHTEEA